MRKIDEMLNNKLLFGDEKENRKEIINMNEISKYLNEMYPAKKNAIEKILKQSEKKNFCKYFQINRPPKLNTALAENLKEFLTTKLETNMVF